VEDYRDPQYYNAQFLKKEGPARFVRHDHDWARDLVATVSPTNGDGAHGRCAGLSPPHRLNDQPAEARVDGNGNGNGHK
jgi:hypothetical protein